MRIGIDATPLLGVRTGIGRYVDALVRTIPQVAPDVELVLTSFTARGAAPLSGYGSSVAPRRLPARVLQAAWKHLDHPTVETMTGPIDVFHGTNFVLPPTRRAAGVVTIHDLSYLHHADTVSAASLAYRTLVPRGLRRAALVLTVTQAMAEEIHDAYGFPSERIVVTYPGVDRSWLSAEQADAAWLAARGLPERYVLFVGTREPRKNLDVLLEAYAVLRRESDAPPLVLVGPRGWGPDIALRGLSASDVIVTGYLPDEALRRVVASADCLVMPSRYEGFGLPVLEALACGTAVVASDIAVFHELGGAHVRFATEGSPVALADALMATLAEPSSMATRGERRSHARRWSWEACAAATSAAYYSAVNG